MIMKYKYLGTFLMLMLSACDFNVTDSPGPQISSSIEIAKKNGTFLCEYKGKKPDSTSNKIPIEAIFLEKKYRREKGFFLEKK